MFRYLESRDEIARAQAKLETTLRVNFRRRAIKDIGHPGGRERGAKVFTDGRYWAWARDWKKRTVINPRRLNWFGLFREGPGAGIIFEANVAYVGRNDRIAGFFAQDQTTGRVYLMHSGRVGGGAKGVGKTAFQAFSAEHPIEVFDAKGAFREGFIVMPVDGVAATRSAARYVDKVHEFKEAVRTGKIFSKEFRKKQNALKEFYAEGRGRRRGSRSSEIDYISRHGEIVDALYEWRKKGGLSKGAKIVKDNLIDMGVSVGSNLREIFEVKTSAGRSAVYSALGQLMVHGCIGKCQKIMVLPDEEILPEDLIRALGRWEITLLRFELSEEKVRITTPQIRGDP